jgi:hypothetical protein
VSPCAVISALTFTCCAAILSAAPRELSPAARDAHAAITEYLGPATCVACHQAQAEDLFHSVHYQQTGPTPYVPNIPELAGKLDMGMNTYCGTPLSSRQYTCVNCHVSYGLMPTDEMTPAQLANIDCLLCHQDAYLRRPAGPFESVTFTDYLGVDRTWQLPIENESGDFAMEPDGAHMAITPLEAARTVHLPTRFSCLRCHAYAAGTNCGKRGDLSSVNVDPPLDVDIHMSAQGGNLSCQNCHTFTDHRVLGRGLDLRESDRPERMTCAGCHAAAPHGSARLNRHADRIACQTCHIPDYARAMTTEMERDWTAPVWAPGLLGGQGGYKPEEVRADHVIPTYRWFDGTSYVYILGQVPPSNDLGEYEFGLPYGRATLTGSDIYPMKEHWGVNARHDETGQIIPHSTFKFFVTGDYEQAVADGMAWAGMTGSWSLVTTHTYQTINHGVISHDDALACGQCHAGLEGGPPRMNLVADLGYGLKGPMSQICTQCHSYEAPPDFVELHSEHVTEKHRDCRWCHQFSRPERGLTIPSYDRPGDMNCDGLVDFADINPFVLAMSGGSSGYYAVYSCNFRNADANQNGVVNFGDINAFVALLAEF